MKIIDIDSWNRKAVYECFKEYDQPIFNISSRLDVTHLVKSCKDRKSSFFTDFLYILSLCLNRIEEFRLRIVDGQVVLFDTIDPSFVVMNERNVIVTCQTPIAEDYGTFYETARNRIDIMKKSTLPPSFNKTDRRDLFYISCLPWIDITTVGNPYNIKDMSSSSIPRITWGRYVEESGKYYMTLDIAAHHSLMDGYPVALGFKAIQEAINNLDSILISK